MVLWIVWPDRDATVHGGFNQIAAEISSQVVAPLAEIIRPRILRVVVDRQIDFGLRQQRISAFSTVRESPTRHRSICQVFRPSVVRETGSAIGARDADEHRLGSNGVTMPGRSERKRFHIGRCRRFAFPKRNFIQNAHNTVRPRMDRKSLVAIVMSTWLFSSNPKAVSCCTIAARAPMSSK